MNEKPRIVLCELLEKYGTALADDRSRCSGLLRDLCGPHKAEVNILIAAMEEQVPNALLKHSSTSVDSDIAISRLVKRLQDDRGLAEDTARWAVESWALALGVIQTVSASSHKAPPPPPPAQPPPPPPQAPQTAWKPTHVALLVVALAVGAAIMFVATPPAPPPPVATGSQPTTGGGDAKMRSELARQQQAVADAQREAAEAARNAQRILLEVEAARKAQSQPDARPTTMAPATPGNDELVQTVRNYYAALDRRDVDSAVSLRNTPPKNFAATVRGIEYFKVNDTRIINAGPTSGSVWVDVIGKNYASAASERWQGAIDLVPMASGRWGIVAMRLTKAGQETATPATAGHDDLVAMVREYYAALDRRDVISALAKWKNPPNALPGQIRTIEYFKVNGARLLTADSGHASVWVDVSGKNYGAATSERWQGSVELELMSSGKWGIVAMKLKKAS